MTYSYPTGTMRGMKVPGSGSLYFYKWTLKGNGKSVVNVKEFFNLYPESESGFPSRHAHFKHYHTSQLDFYTHSLQGAAQCNHSLQLLSSSSQAAGGQGHLDGSCWGADWHLSYTNISQRQSFSGGRNNVLGQVKPQSAEARQVYLCTGLTLDFWGP